MVDRRFEQLGRDSLAALIGSDDKANDRADVARGLTGNAFELRLRSRVAPAHDATEAVGNEPVCLGGPEEPAARGPILLLGPGRVVIDRALPGGTGRPGRV